MATLKDLSNDIAALVEKASKSVVQVDARRGRAGTGIVWDSGLVLTANHVVQQEDDIEVGVDEKRTKATVVGRDPVNDVALLKVDGRIKRPYRGIGKQEAPLPEAVKGRVNQDSGLLIVAGEPQSPADKAGLMQGDTLVALDGTATKSLEDLYSGLRKIKVGASQTVKVVRAGEVKEFPVTVGEAGR